MLEACARGARGRDRAARTFCAFRSREFTLQAHLLRVLDRQGESQGLGARVRRADPRVVAATNRAVTELKYDFAARFTLKVEVPSRSARAEDVPLLVRHLFARAAAGNEEVWRRFCDAKQGAFEVRGAPALVDRRLRHTLGTNTRMRNIRAAVMRQSCGSGVAGVSPKVARVPGDRWHVSGAKVAMRLEPTRDADGPLFAHCRRAHSRKREMSIRRLIGAVVLLVGWTIRMRRLRRQLWLQPHHRHVLGIWPVCEDSTISCM